LELLSPQSQNAVGGAPLQPSAETTDAADSAAGTSPPIPWDELDALCQDKSFRRKARWYANNLARDYYKHHQTERRPGGDPDDGVAPPTTLELRDEPDVIQRSNLVDELVELYKEKKRQFPAVVLAARALEEKTLPEIAQALSVPESRVKSAFRIARHEMQRRLARRQIARRALQKSLAVAIGAGAARRVADAIWGRATAKDLAVASLGVGVVVVAAIIFWPPPAPTVACKIGQRGCRSEEETCTSNGGTVEVVDKRTTHVTFKPKELYCSCFDAKGLGLWVDPDGPSSCLPGESIHDSGVDAGDHCREGVRCNLSAGKCPSGNPSNFSILTCKNGRWGNPRQQDPDKHGCIQGLPCRNQNSLCWGVDGARIRQFSCGPDNRWAAPAR